MDDRRLELRVAMLALAALASGAGLLWLLGSFRDTGDAHLLVDFAHSGGIPVGAPVKVAGVTVGRVRTIELTPERVDPNGRPLPIRMDLTVQSAVLGKLRRDAHVGMGTQGALGEPFVEIDPVGASGATLRPGDTVRGDDPPRLDQLIARMDRLSEAAAGLLTGGAGGAGGLLTDAAHLTHSADAMITENREVIASTVQDVRQAASDLRELAQQAHALMGDPKLRSALDDASAVTANLRENVPPLTADARHLLHSADNLAGDFAPQDGTDLKAAIARHEKASASLEDIATRADRIVTEIDEGKGSVGGLVKDDQLYKDLKALVADLKAHPWKVLWKQ